MDTSSRLFGTSRFRPHWGNPAIYAVCLSLGITLFMFHKELWTVDGDGEFDLFAIWVNVPAVVAGSALGMFVAALFSAVADRRAATAGRSSAAQQSTTAFEVPRDLAVWEAAALYQSSGVLVHWFRTMLDAGALFAEVDPEDPLSTTFSLGDLTVVPERDRTIVQYFLGEGPDQRTVTLRVIKGEGTNFRALPDDVDLNTRLSHIQRDLVRRLSEKGWFSKPYKDSMANEGSFHVRLDLVVVPIFVYFIPYLISSNYLISASLTAAAVGIAAHFAGNRLTVEGARRYAEVDSLRRLLVAGELERVEGYEEFGVEHEMYSWAVALGLIEPSVRDTPLEAIAISSTSFTNVTARALRGAGQEDLALLLSAGARQKNLWESMGDGFKETRDEFVGNLNRFKDRFKK